MSMEKITKEELLEKLGGTPLSDEELEKIAGGISICENLPKQALLVCLASNGIEPVGELLGMLGTIATNPLI